MTWKSDIYKMRAVRWKKLTTRRIKTVQQISSKIKTCYCLRCNIGRKNEDAMQKKNKKTCSAGSRVQKYASTHLAYTFALNETWRNAMYFFIFFLLSKRFKKTKEKRSETCTYTRTLSHRGIITFSYSEAYFVLKVLSSLFHPPQNLSYLWCALTTSKRVG